jgi:hypothetical protein
VRAVIDSLGDRSFTYALYEKLYLKKGKKITAYQIIDYPSIVRYIVIQKFSFDFFKMACKKAHKLLVVYNVITAYESEKTKNEGLKDRVRNLRVPNINR